MPRSGWNFVAVYLNAYLPRKWAHSFVLPLIETLFALWHVGMALRAAVFYAESSPDTGKKVFGVLLAHFVMLSVGVATVCVGRWYQHYHRLTYRRPDGQLSKVSYLDGDIVYAVLAFLIPRLAALAGERNLLLVGVVRQLQVLFENAQVHPGSALVGLIVFSIQVIGCHFNRKIVLHQLWAVVVGVANFYLAQSLYPLPPDPLGMILACLAAVPPEDENPARLSISISQPSMIDSPTYSSEQPSLGHPRVSLFLFAGFFTITFIRWLVRLRLTVSPCLLILSVRSALSLDLD